MSTKKESALNNDDDSEEEEFDETKESSPPRLFDGHEDDNDSDSDNNGNGGVSVEAIKVRTIGRSIPSIFQSHSRSSHQNYAAMTAAVSSSSWKSPSSKSNTPNNSNISNSNNNNNNNNNNGVVTVAQQLKHELICPICQDLLYNPVSLLCGHNFCFACLDWWLERVQQRQEDEEYATTTTPTCPTCREVIPTTTTTTTCTTTTSLPSLPWSVEENDTNNDSNEDDNHDTIIKPRIRINTALKTVLTTLYPMEMSLRHQAELQNQKRAISGEAGGYHTLGCHEIVPLLDEGTHELYFLHNSSTSPVTGTTVNDDCDDEEYGWRALNPLSSPPGWSSSSSSSSNINRGDGEYGGGGGLYSQIPDPRILIRRNIVLDENDQRYQLSLGLTKCSYHPDVKVSSTKFITSIATTTIPPSLITTHHPLLKGCYYWGYT
jgi:RING-type zinc-finger